MTMTDFRCARCGVHLETHGPIMDCYPDLSTDPVLDTPFYSTEHLARVIDYLGARATPKSTEDGIADDVEDCIKWARGVIWEASRADAYDNYLSERYDSLHEPKVSGGEVSFPAGYAASPPEQDDELAEMNEARERQARYDHLEDE